MSRPSPPFRRGRYEDLPETPHREHGYFDSEAVDLHVATAHFGGMNVHVRKHGSGPPLLLVHGLMTSSYSWRYALEPLGRHFTCYAPDLPGAGRSDRPQTPPYTPAALASWLAEVQRQLGIRGCAVIGNSMGGYLCLVLALADPESMSRLVDLHSPGVPEFRLTALQALLAVPGSRALLRHLIRRDPLRWAHRHVHYYDESLKSLEEAREYGEPMRSREGAQILVKYLNETMHPRHMRAFHRALRTRVAQGGFPMPLLLIYARRDPMVPPRFGRIFAERIPTAELVWLDRASHFAHVDAVERFVPPVLEFLGRSQNRG